jgi:hypothetical protein
LNRQIEIFVSCGGHFVFAGFLLGFRRHIYVPLITSTSTIRQAEKNRSKSKGRERAVRGFFSPENWRLRNGDLARFDVLRLRQSQSHKALLDLCADFVCVN